MTLKRNIFRHSAISFRSVQSMVLSFALLCMPCFSSCAASPAESGNAGKSSSNPVTVADSFVPEPEPPVQETLSLTGDAEFVSGELYWNTDLSLGHRDAYVSVGGEEFTLLPGSRAHTIYENGVLTTEISRPDGAQITVSGAISCDTGFSVTADGLVANNGPISEMRLGDGYYTEMLVSPQYKIEYILKAPYYQAQSDNWFSANSGAASTIYSPFGNEGGMDVYNASLGALSLCGAAGSAEYEAYKEWSSLGTARSEYVLKHREYANYAVSSDADAKALDGICSKYGLKKLTGAGETVSSIELADEYGLGGIIDGAEYSYTYMEYEAGGKEPVSKTEDFTGYAFDDGTLILTGCFSSQSQTGFTWELSRSYKGTLNPYYVQIESTGRQEWDYTTASGMQIKLVMTPTRSYIIADLDGSYIVITAMRGSLAVNEYDWFALPREELQSFADSVHWELLD